MRDRSARVEWRDQRGVTLVELTIVLVIFGMIVAATMLLWEQTQKSYFQGSEAADLQANVRVALDQMAHEVRRAARNLTDCAFDFDALDNCSTAKRDTCRTKLGNTGFDCNNVFAIPTATTTSLRIRQDLDSDGLTTGTNEDVTFAFDSVNSRITRNPGGGAQPLAEHIIANPDGTPIFQYWRYTLVGGLCTGASLQTFTPGNQTDRDCIRRLTITLTARATIGGETLTRTARTDVDLRPR